MSKELLFDDEEEVSEEVSNILSLNEVLRLQMLKTQELTGITRELIDQNQASIDSQTDLTGKLVKNMNKISKAIEKLSLNLELFTGDTDEELSN